MSLEKDPVTGTDLTGHEWDGITELNTPVPRISTWALWIATGIAVLLWILYPAFPYMSDFTRGALGYSSRGAVQKAVAEGQATRDLKFAVFGSQNISALAADPTLQARFGAPISKLYADNCAACHGRDLQGQAGFPDLTDAEWLWSSTPEEVEQTIRHGINARDDETRISQMLAFGRDKMLEKPELEDVTDFVLSLSGGDHDAESAARGSEVFADNCSSCHGDEGRGDPEVGAPDLTDEIWIYAGSRKGIGETLHSGRQGVMPAWQRRLSDAEIRMLTVYVLWSGNDRQN